MLKRYILLIAFFTCSLSLCGQQYAYKFYKTGDSAKFAALTEISRKSFFYMADSAKIVFDEAKANMTEAEYRKLMENIERLAFLDYQGSGQYASIEKALNSTNKDTITHIGFYGMHHKKIPYKIVKFKNLQGIEIIGTQINKLPWILNWSIFKINKLKEVKIYNQENEKRFLFKKNKHVEQLVYRENPLAPQPKKMWKLKNVKELDLVRNDFRENSHFHLEKFSHLKEVNLRNNQIKIENLSKKQAKSVEKLILSRNKLTSVPDNIGNFPNLKELQLAENNIETANISPAIAQLKQLEVLSFYKNQLDSLPEFLLNFPELIELDLYYNKIEKIPEGIAQLTKLERLYLANNKLYSIPDEIGELSQLKELYLKHNRISYLPNSLCKLTHITIFHINNNYLQGFPACILAYKQLQDLDISYNEINTIPPEILELKKLKFFWMRGISFEAQNKEEALAVKRLLEGLQQNGVKVSIDLE